MNIHKGFCDELGKLRRSTVGDVITSLGVVTLEGRVIMNLKDGLSELEQIFYTVDFLEENKLVYIESHQTAEYVPDFNPDSFLKASSDKYQVSQMHAMPNFLKKYWGIGLVVNPVYSKFISNSYRTDEEVEKVCNRWLPFVTAIVAAFVTALLTAWLTNSQNCIDRDGLKSSRGGYQETLRQSY